MRFLHAMVRVLDVDAALRFFSLLGLHETRRSSSETGRFTLIYLSTGAPGDAAEIELTHNWDQTEAYGNGRAFGHLAFETEDIDGLCHHLQDNGVEILRPPRDGRMAFVKSPDGISVELLQVGRAQPPREPWLSMANTGSW
jgi:lactoylglutathione lyase